MPCEVGTGSLVDSAGGALGSVKNKLKLYNDLDYSTYMLLSNMCLSYTELCCRDVGLKQSKFVDTTK